MNVAEKKTELWKKFEGIVDSEQKRMKSTGMECLDLEAFEFWLDSVNDLGILTEIETILKSGIYYQNMVSELTNKCFGGRWGLFPNEKAAFRKKKGLK